MEAGLGTGQFAARALNPAPPWAEFKGPEFYSQQGLWHFTKGQRKSRKFLAALKCSSPPGTCWVGEAEWEGSPLSLTSPLFIQKHQCILQWWAFAGQANGPLSPQHPGPFAEARGNVAGPGQTCSCPQYTVTAAGTWPQRQWRPWIWIALGFSFHQVTQISLEAMTALALWKSCSDSTSSRTVPFGLSESEHCQLSSVASSSAAGNRKLLFPTRLLHDIQDFIDPSYSPRQP